MPGPNILIPTTYNDLIKLLEKLILSALMIQKRIIPQIQRIANLGTMDDKKLKVPPAKTQLKLRNISSKNYKK